MKYIEHVKTVVLTLLVLLSIALTFSIWTYTPNYKVIEKNETETTEVTIGQKKKIEDVLNPYKVIFHQNNQWNGTVSASVIDDLMGLFKHWKVNTFSQVDSNMTVEELNDLMHQKNSFTLFFMGNIPFPTLQSIMPFENNELPEVSFNRIIVDWDMYQSKELQYYFVNTEDMYVYRATVEMPNPSHFIEKVIDPSKEYEAYQEIQRQATPSLYVVDEKLETIQYTYYIDEIKLELFKNVLFADPSIVQRNVESIQSEKFTDGMSLMTVDTVSKSLNYVYPAAESSNYIEPSKLLRSSFDFINEHGGITADYRYAWMNEENHQIDYQLFLQGLPVTSDETLTSMSTTWGDNRIFRYKRPYYALDMDITSEKEVTILLSGRKIVEQIQQSNSVTLSDLDELMVGYYLSKNDNQNLFKLEPSWFYVHDGNWIRITPAMLGGVTSGLE